MGKEIYDTFRQDTLASAISSGDVGGGVCLGTCIEYIKYLNKAGTSDSIVKSFSAGSGSGLTKSLLETGDKGIATHTSVSGDRLDLWGQKRPLEEMGFTDSVGKDTGAVKDTVVSEIKASGRFAFHILYFDVYKDVTSKAGWHVVALKGNGWTGVSFDRIFYAMDPNQGIWKITSTASLGDWLWSDIKARYNPFNMYVYTITK